MKKIIIIAVCLLTVISSCTKSTSGGSGGGTTPNLNNTEKSLLGTWFLESNYNTLTHYSGSTLLYLSGTTTGYSNDFYITFMSDYYPPGTTTFGHQCNGSVLVPTFLAQNPTAKPGVSSGSWNFNTATNYLVLNGFQCSMSLSGSILVITYISSQDTSILTFHK